MKRLYFVTLFLLILTTSFYSCNNKNEKQNKPLINKTAVEYKLFKTEKGWGYDIFINSKKYIHQPVIPSVGGLKSFSTKEKAQKAAELVVKKIKFNIMPPSLNENELDSIGAL